MELRTPVCMLSKNDGNAFMRSICRVLLATFIVLSSDATTRAQRTVQLPDGRTMTVADGATLPAGAVPAAGGAPPNAGKPGEAKPEEKKEGEGKADEKKPAESDTVKRPEKPARVPDPREFDVKPDANRRLQFTFHGQMWPDVLQWLASNEGKSLDWQELPNDYIHVGNNHPQTLPEIRDLFNRLLFDRGFTIIEQGSVLQVVKLEKIDPSLLVRVDDEAELLDLPAHQVAKITFKLPDDLKADKAAEDVKPLLSKYAKVQPLMSTNRLLVIDLVGNLREVSTIVNAEHAAAVGKVVPREFPIRFARADHVADQVMILLGLDPSSRRTPQELQVEQQRLQLFAQMQQQGKDVTKFLRGGDMPVVYLAVNHRNNAIVVNAPAKELGVIERAIELLDVPDGMLAGSAIVQLTMERYQLATMKPQAVITALQELGNLDPRTQFKSDTSAKIVFAHATPADHLKIKAMIEDLDGTGRQFEVIWLRKLPADAVAATVHSLMVGEEEEDNNNNNRYRSYYYYGYSNQEEETESPTKGFRVDADVENNRLLLWANENELKEVRKLLAKLGELPGDSSNPHTVRVLDSRDADDTRKMLELIRQMWPSMAPNSLEIDDEQFRNNRTQQLDRSRPKEDGDERSPVPASDAVKRETQGSSPETADVSTVEATSLESLTGVAAVAGESLALAAGTLGTVVGADALVVATNDHELAAVEQSQ
ncbi:MAG: hypothetical protein KDA92_22705, partial [Planctomycetales bacterium]|nr:hypothetical protein [Planctomycetales bacterium]